MHSQKNPKSVIVIPVYNHSATLYGVVESALKANDNVMVVDDGSTDKSADTISDLNVHLKGFCRFELETRN